MKKHNIALANTHSLAIRNSLNFLSIELGAGLQILDA